MRTKPTFLRCETCRGTGSYRGGDLYERECPACQGDGRVPATKVQDREDRLRVATTVAMRQPPPGAKIWY